MNRMLSFSLLGFFMMSSVVHAQDLTATMSCAHYLEQEERDTKSGLKDDHVRKNVAFLQKAYEPSIKALIPPLTPRELFTDLVEATHQDCEFSPDETLGESIDHANHYVLKENHH